MKIEKIQIVDDSRNIVYGEIFFYHDIELFGFRQKGWGKEVPPEDLEEIAKLIRKMDKEVELNKRSKK